MRIRESHTPGRKVGLWGCDFCDFTHVNVSKVQAHVQELHLAALQRTWEAAALWQQGGGESSREGMVPYDEGSSGSGGSAMGHHVDSPAQQQQQHHQQQQMTVAGRQFRFAVPVIGQSGDSAAAGLGCSGGGLVAVQYVDPGDDGGGSLPLEPIVICKIDDEEEEESCAPPRGGPF